MLIWLVCRLKPPETADRIQAGRRCQLQIFSRDMRMKSHKPAFGTGAMNSKLLLLRQVLHLFLVGRNRGWRCCRARTFRVAYSQGTGGGQCIIECARHVRCSRRSVRRLRAGRQRRRCPVSFPGSVATSTTTTDARRWGAAATSTCTVV